jgi:hypothetical protein
MIIPEAKEFFKNKSDENGIPKQFQNEGYWRS